MMQRLKNTCKLIILLAFCNTVQAQETDYRAPQGTNNWFIELGGPALFYSLNYEKYLYRSYDEQYTWAAHVGLGYNPINCDILNTVYLERNLLMAPFSTSLLKGSGKEKLEIGAGFTLFSKEVNRNEVLPHALIGFRVMESNRVCFRVNYMPFWQNGAVTHWLGISLGQNFSFK